jgi:predicted P-loop ATPase
MTMPTTQNTNDFADTDRLTVLKCLDENTLATKRWYFNGDGSYHVKAYSLGKWFSCVQYELAGLEDLWGVLCTINTHMSEYVVRGDPTEHMNPHRTRRLANKGKDGTPPAFRDPPQGRRWLMVDFDSGDIPFDADTPLESLEALMGRLPVEFRDTACVYQFSSSAGFKPGLRVHLWYWLDRPYPNRIIKDYLRTLDPPCDLALYTPVLPHYVADPVLNPGVPDPIRGQRIGLRGSLEQSVLNLPIRVDTKANTVESQKIDDSMPAEWTPEDLERCLSELPIEEYAGYESWITICAAAHYATGGLGLQVFIDWCMGNPVYLHKTPEITRHWHSFGVEGREALITTATLKREYLLRSGMHWGTLAAHEEFEPIVQEQTNEGHWMEGVVCNSKGQIQKTVHNVVLILEQHPDTKELFCLNERNLRIYYTRAPVWDLGNKSLDKQVSDDDAVYCTAWFNATVRLSVGVDMVYKGILSVAGRRRMDPFRDWLGSLMWDGVGRLTTWLTDYAKTDDSRYVQRVSRCFLISAVARAFVPGCKVDTMLILGGRQGAGKSTLLKNLVGSDLFTDHLEDIHGKDSRMQVHGPVIIEVAELEAFSKPQTAAIKSFISTRFDNFRPPYGRAMDSFPRRCVFAGSTNRDTYLKDETGGRRFWPIAVGYWVDNEGLLSVRDQLWAEAVHAYKAGEPWWLGEEDEALARVEQEAHREIDDWEEAIGGYLTLDKETAVMHRGLDASLATDRFSRAGARVWTSTAEILTYALQVSVDRQKSGDQRRVAKALRAIGWEMRRETIDGVRVRRFHRNGGE